MTALLLVHGIRRRVQQDPVSHDHTNNQTHLPQHTVCRIQQQIARKAHAEVRIHLITSSANCIDTQ